MFDLELSAYDVICTFPVQVYNLSVVSIAMLCRSLIKTNIGLQVLKFTASVHIAVVFRLQFKSRFQGVYLIKKMQIQPFLKSESVVGSSTS